MKIGLDDLLDDTGIQRLFLALKHNAIKQGDGAATRFRTEEKEIRAALAVGIKRLQKLRANRLKGSAWSRAETWRMFQSRQFQTSAALVQAAIKEEVFSIADARCLADAARDLSVTEGVASKTIEKPGSGTQTRTVTKFGPIKNVRNRAMALMVEAVSGPFEFEFCQLGRGGVNAAAKYIGECITQGYRFWVTFDLTSAYPSVKKDHVKDIVPLHGKLMREIGFPITSHNKATNKEGGRPGLAEGASHSSKILSAFTDGPLRQLGGSVKVLCYADNIAIGARTIDEAKCAFNTFKNAISALKAGPIHLHSVTLCDAHHHHGHIFKGKLKVRHAVDFCHYRISYDTLDAGLRYRPNTEAFARAKNEAFGRLKTIIDEDTMEAVVDAYLKNWMRSFRLWQPNVNTIECLRQTRDRWIYGFRHGQEIDVASG